MFWKSSAGRAYHAGGRLSPGFLLLEPLALLHAAARCDRVTLRGADELSRFIRRPDESAVAFHERIATGVPDDQPLVAVADGEAFLAMLYQGNVELPDGSSSYALF
jgi:hypothetical protein